MWRKYLFWGLFLSGLALAAQAWAQSASSDDDRVRAITAKCDRLVCRKASKDVALRTRDGKTVALATELYPYLDDQGAMVIYPGESIGLFMPAKGDVFGAPVLANVSGPDGPVDLGSRPAANLLFAFQQLDGKLDMLLTIGNKTDLVVKVDATMFVPVSGGWRAIHTSTCPVDPPQGSLKVFQGLEHWPHPVGMLVIRNIRALPKGTAQTCE